MSNPQDTRNNPLSIRAFLAPAVLVLLFLYTNYRGLIWPWPPDWVERRTQRRLLSERIESVGGWDVLKRDCAMLVEKQKLEPFTWFRFNNTNQLPAAIAGLKPTEVRFDPPELSRGTRFDTIVPVVRIRLFGLPSTGGNASPYLGLHVVCSTNTTAYKPRPGAGAPGNRHSTFRRVAENVFEIY